MKFTKLLAVLAVTEIAFRKPLMGGKATVSLTEEQMEKIENALVEKDTSALEQELETLKNEKQQYLQEIDDLKQSVNQALTDNKLEVSEDLNENIALLGKTCKEYGDKQNVHTALENDGKEKNEFDAVVNMADEHNANVFRR